MTGFAYTGAGLLVGFIVGLTGVGGGSLMTPLLILAFKVPVLIAVGTDLLYAALSKAGGVVVHARRGNIEWRIAARLALGSVPAALITLVALQYFGAGSGIETLVNTVLGFGLVMTSLILLAGDRLLARRWPRTALSDGQQRLVLAVLGAFVGAMVTLSSIGAGALCGAVLMLLYRDLPVARIVGTDIAHAVPIAALAGLGHIHLGTVNYVMLGYLLAGSLPGIYLGARCTGLVPDRLLRRSLAGLLLIIGLRFAI